VTATCPVAGSWTCTVRPLMAAASPKASGLRRDTGELPPDVDGELEPVVGVAAVVDAAELHAASSATDASTATPVVPSRRARRRWLSE